MPHSNSQILPNFLIVGASKCGTTSLWTHLNRHPDVFWAEPKEPMFFNQEANYSCGIEWYANLFKGAGDAKLIGEATTSYTYAPHTAEVPARIHELIPDCKLIYMLRPPVSRTYSHYVQELQVRVWAPQGELGTFEQSLEKCPMFIDAGKYLMQIEQYLRYFDREQIKVVLLEDLKKNPAAIVHDVQEFLGLDPIDLNKTTSITANSQGIHHARDLLNEKIENFKSIPGLGALTRAIPKSMRSRLYHKILGSKRIRKAASLELQVEPALPETNERLREVFEQPNRALGEFLQRDLSHWDQPAVVA